MTEQATNGAADEQQPQFSLQRIYPVSYTHLTLPTILRV